MERPWLLLYRVLHVHAPGGGGDNLHAAAEEHGLVVDAEGDALAQDAEVGDAEDHVEAADALAQDAEDHVDAGVGDAEDHVEAEDALAQELQNAAVAEADEDHVEAADAAAQEAQNAAVAEAEEGVQEHDAGGEEDEDAAGENNVAAVDVQALLEEAVIDVNTNIILSQWIHTIMLGQGGGESEITVTVAPPPLVSSLTTGPHARRAHPDPERPDMFPYIVATGRFCLLVHFAVAPFYGTDFGQAPNQSNLVVVSHFLREQDGVRIAACADHVPDRPDDDVDDIPALRNIESIGLVCYQEGEADRIQIAELIVTTGDPEAAVVVYNGAQINDDGWGSSFFPNPLLPVNHLRDWVPRGTVTVNSTVWWYDLSWGLICCDLALPQEEQRLDFHRLPPGRVLLVGVGVLDLDDLLCRRCVAVSENLVRYVEIILSPNPNDQPATTVNMWYRDLEANPQIWRTNYSVSFEEIWDDDSYEQTGLPRTIPTLVGVSPVDSSVVYFSLNQQLFGVNVPEHTVVDCELYHPLNRSGPDDEPVTSRYFIPWNIGADAAINIGHQPENPSDHGDSSAGGPADEGEIDYESPPS